MNNNVLNELTIYDLNILFLESKYKQVAPNTYGTYQYRAKLVNEYLGNTKIGDINLETIEGFDNYLNNEKKWEYSSLKSHDKSIDNTIKYLIMLLKYFQTLQIDSKIKNKKEGPFYNCYSIKEINELLLKLESIRASNQLNKTLNIKLNN